jgi:hypothetical protein
MSNSFYVYVHSRASNGEPFYVGKGRGRRCENLCRRNAHWKNIVAKAGGFYTSILASGLDEDFAFLLESEAIDKYRRLGVRLSNLTDGGEGPAGMRHSDETKAKWAAAKLGRKRGPYSEEHRRKISQSLKGRSVSPETRARISEATTLAMKSQDIRAKIVAGNINRERKPHSQETKDKMRAASLGRPKSDAARANMSIAQRRRFNSN